MSTLTNLFAVVGISYAGVLSAMNPTHLTTEYRIDPEGIDETAPRFSWQVESDQRNRLQTAYQVLVADSEEALAADQGTLWDSGKTASPATLHIAYAGTPLKSRMQCWWKVRVWDNEDAPSSWSEVARFSMGLLGQDDWQAQWIGFDAPGGPDFASAGAPAMDRAQWIWHDEGNPRESAPPGYRWFRHALMLPDNAVVVSARLFISGDDAVEAWINGTKLNGGQPAMKEWRRLNPHLVGGFLKPGKNILAVMAENKDGAAGWVAALRVTLRNGATVDLYTDKTWKSFADNPGKDWAASDYNDSAWRPAKELAAFGGAPWAESQPKTAQFKPVAQLRRVFKAKAGVRQATLYASALGLYAFHVNGERVGADYFTPGWTEYRNRVYYQTYDVTSLVRAGAANALCAELANGWYAGHVGLKGSELYGTKPRLFAQLELEYENGTREVIATDGTWRATTGEIRGADLLMGETRDKRLAQTGWALPEYADADWSAVVVDMPEIMPARIEAYPGAPVRQFESLPALTFTEPQPGVYVYDLGQNMVGWARITVHGEAGQRVQVRYTEMLQDNGMPYTEALRSAQATDTYILAGSGGETLEPAFTFHGFRYVEVRGIEAPLPLDAVTGIVLHADVPITAEFETSNPLLNQLFHNITWGLKGNYLEAPTDCPQRDERLGWTGDAQFFMPTALYTAGIGAFYTKWLVDLIEDGQQENGSFPHVAPDVKLGGGAVAWGDAAMICPWLIYQFYGDTRVIEKHYDNLIRGMDFLEQTSENHIRKDLGFGDWLNLGGGAKDEVICTAYYAYLADIMSQMAALIGRKDAAERYAALHLNIRQAFIDNFVDDSGHILDSSQTGYALAFAFDLIPEDLREAAAAHYIKEIERFDGHLATGFIGTPRLLPTLSLAGRDDVAYRLLMNTTYPSWLFQVTLGATTMWERWNGWTPDKGFADSGMNSFNHYAFGAVGEWLYSRVAGIRPDAPGFEKIYIEPVPGGGLTYARMNYQSIRGPIISSWRVEGDSFLLDVEIPANTTATVCIPTGDAASVTEGGKPLEEAGISVETILDGSILCRLGSGTYQFQALARK